MIGIAILKNDNETIYTTESIKCPAMFNGYLATHEIQDIIAPYGELYFQNSLNFPLLDTLGIPHEKTEPRRSRVVADITVYGEYVDFENDEENDETLHISIPFPYRSYFHNADIDFLKPVSELDTEIQHVRLEATAGMVETGSDNFDVDVINSIDVRISNQDSWANGELLGTPGNLLNCSAVVFLQNDKKISILLNGFINSIDIDYYGISISVDNEIGVIGETSGNDFVSTGPADELFKELIHSNTGIRYTPARFMPAMGAFPEIDIHVSSSEKMVEEFLEKTRLKILPTADGRLRLHAPAIHFPDDMPEIFPQDFFTASAKRNFPESIRFVSPSGSGHLVVIFPFYKNTMKNERKEIEVSSEDRGYYEDSMINLYKQDPFIFEIGTTDHIHKLWLYDFCVLRLESYKYVINLDSAYQNPGIPCRIIGIDRENNIIRAERVGI